MSATIGSLWIHPETKNSFLLTHLLEDSKQVKGLHVAGGEMNESVFRGWFLEQCFERLDPGDDGYQAALLLMGAACSAKADRLTEEIWAVQQSQRTVETLIAGGE